VEARVPVDGICSHPGLDRSVLVGRSFRGRIGGKNDRIPSIFSTAMTCASMAAMADDGLQGSTDDE
jgi:hypothetical protein